MELLHRAPDGHGRSGVLAMSDAIKFPKTPRLTEILQKDVQDAWRHHVAVVEEKVDGANVGIWFEDGELRLQSRGHILRGGAGERQFAPFHGWAAERLEALKEVLESRYVLYGEWCFAKNKSFYDALPDWLIGYDILDRQNSRFLATTTRDILLDACDVCIVPHLWLGAFGKVPSFGSFVGPSRFKTPRWREAFAREADRAGVKNAMEETDNSDLMEGVYVRVEDGQSVVGRMKLHREGYTKVSNEHWRDRPLIRNIRRSLAPTRPRSPLGCPC